MVERIKGTNLVMDEGEIKDPYGKVMTKAITTHWCGERVVLSEEWIRNMHKFKIYNDDDEDISRELLNVRFVKHNRNIDDDGVAAYSIYLAKPIEIGEYRVIARYPKYAINKYGDVMKIKNKSVRRLKDTLKTYEKYKEHNKYPFIYIFDSRLGISTKVYVHLLLGHTWKENDDWENKYILNHKDHDKMNVTLDNFEWTTPRGNTQAYYDHRNKLNQ